MISLFESWTGKKEKEQKPTSKEGVKAFAQMLKTIK